MKLLFLTLLGFSRSMDLTSMDFLRGGESSDPRANQVVCVTWGTRDCDRRGQCSLSESIGTGLYCTYRDMTGVLTNFHVLPSADDASPAKYGKVHFEYANRSKMGIEEMQSAGIDMNPDFAKGGFYFNGGEEASGHDWAFVCVDNDEVARKYPNITPYNLMKSCRVARASSGEQITVFHHRNGEPLLKWQTTIDEDEGLQGTLDHNETCNRKTCGGDFLEHGSSGSPIWMGDTVIGVFWGELTQQQGRRLMKYNRFATIQAVMEQLDQEINAQQARQGQQATVQKQKVHEPSQQPKVQPKPSQAPVAYMPVYNPDKGTFEIVPIIIDDPVNGTLEILPSEASTYPDRYLK